MAEFNTTRFYGSKQDRGRKTLVPAILALLALAVLVCVIFRGGAKGPEDALPKMDSVYQVLVKIENPGVLRNRIKTVRTVLSSIQRMPPMAIPDDLKNAAEGWEGVWEWADSLLLLANSAAFMAAGEEYEKPTQIYLSFIPNEKAFGEMISNPGHPLYTIEKWDQDKGKEGWIAKPRDPAGKLPKLYVLRQSSSKGAPVFVSDNPDSIDRMKRAYASSLNRLSIKRRNAAPDFVQAKVSMKTRDGETKVATSEVAWIEDDTSAHIQIAANAISLITGNNMPKSGVRGFDFPLMGSGDVTMISAIDIPYLCFFASPRAIDPVHDVLDKSVGKFAGMVPEPLMTMIYEVMKFGRITVVAVSGKDEALEDGVVYFVVESKAKEAMDRLANVVKLAMRKSSLPGWDSFYTLNLRRGLNVVFAHKSDAMMFGIGTRDQYSKKAQIPKNIKDFAAPKDIANLVVTPTFFGLLTNDMSKSLFGGNADMRFLHEMAEKNCTVQMRVITPEKSDIGFYWGTPAK